VFPNVKIGIIGAGMIGATAARLLTRGGHAVAISNSRDPESLAGLVADLGASALPVAEAVRFGDVVLLAIPFGKFDTLPAPEFAGKVVIDATNYYPSRDGQIDFPDGTSSELLARHLPGARVVKAFNTLYFKTLDSASNRDLTANDRLAILLAGDDAAAKATVGQLITDMGFTPVDTGSLHEGGRRQQPDSALYNQPVTAAAARAALGDAR
jgi:8-hydroxy-5-deazaflavin:NADPH oxidoreductase